MAGAGVYAYAGGSSLERRVAAITCGSGARDQSVSASLVRISSDVSSNQPEPVPGTIKDPGSGHVTRVTRGIFSDHDPDDSCCQTSPCKGRH